MIGRSLIVATCRTVWTVWTVWTVRIGILILKWPRKVDTSGYQFYRFYNLVTSGKATNRAIKPTFCAGFIRTRDFVIMALTRPPKLHWLDWLLSLAVSIHMSWSRAKSLFYAKIKPIAWPFFGKCFLLGPIFVRDDVSNSFCLKLKQLQWTLS